MLGLWFVITIEIARKKEKESCTRKIPTVKLFGYLSWPFSFPETGGSEDWACHETFNESSSNILPSNLTG